jgi:hypothetical protein
VLESAQMVPEPWSGQRKELFKFKQLHQKQNGLAYTGSTHTTQHIHVDLGQAFDEAFNIFCCVKGPATISPSFCGEMLSDYKCFLFHAEVRGVKNSWLTLLSCWKYFSFAWMKLGLVRPLALLENSYVWDFFVHCNSLNLILQEKMIQ